MQGAECENMSKCVIDIETTGLEPWTDRIVCIGIRDIGSSRSIVFFDENEEILVKKFISYFRRKQFKEIIGYNVNFDIRFIFTKCLKYEICAGYVFNAKFTDVMDNMRSVRRIFSYNKPGKLDQWLNFVFGIGKIENGESVNDMFEKREFTRIINYCRWDVDMTFRLWKRIRMVLCEK